jgi:hypothetical protein
MPIGLRSGTALLTSDGGVKIVINWCIHAANAESDCCAGPPDILPARAAGNTLSQLWHSVHSRISSLLVSAFN